MKSLRDVIDGRAGLNVLERDSLCELLAARCSAKTKEQLRIYIDMLCPICKNHGIYGRVLFRDNRAEYIVAQDWIEERRLLRRLIME